MLAGKVHGTDDRLLLTQLSEGNRYAFDSLYHEYKTDVMNEAYKRLNDIDLAKDITQDVFTALWVRGSAAVIENLPGYLYTAVKNNVLRLMQRQSKFVPIPAVLQELSNNQNRADAGLLYNELQNAYQAWIAALPEQQRIIYELRYTDNLTPEEIAQKLNLSPKTVRNQLGRALQRLRTTFMLIQLIFWITGR